MYDSYHEVIVANKLDKTSDHTYTIAGPICESGDILARDRRLPRVEKGDLIAVLDTGAYGFAMSSQYNGRTRASEVLVNEGDAELIRARESYGDLLMGQNLSLIHISEPTRLGMISYAVFCLKKKKK